MQIAVNGEHRTIDDGLSIADLLVTLGMANRRVAVEHNGDIVPRSQHPQVMLQDGDQLEIVHAIGGG